MGDAGVKIVVLEIFNKFSATHRDLKTRCSRGAVAISSDTVAVQSKLIVVESRRGLVATTVSRLYQDCITIETLEDALLRDRTKG